MAKTVTLTYEKCDYTLEFTRRSIKQMEDNGFIVTEVEKKPMMILDIFRGAFIAHHPRVSREKIDEIYDQIGNKRALVERLVEMYTEPINALLSDSTEGNAIWKSNG